MGGAGVIPVELFLIYEDSHTVCSFRSVERIRKVERMVVNQKEQELMAAAKREVPASAAIMYSSLRLHCLQAKALREIELKSRFVSTFTHGKLDASACAYPVMWLLRRTAHSRCCHLRSSQALKSGEGSVMSAGVVLSARFACRSSNIKNPASKFWRAPRTFSCVLSTMWETLSASRQTISRSRKTTLMWPTL